MKNKKKKSTLNEPLANDRQMVNKVKEQDKEKDIHEEVLEESLEEVQGGGLGHLVSDLKKRRDPVTSAYQHCPHTHFDCGVVTVHC